MNLKLSFLLLFSVTAFAQNDYLFPNKDFDKSIPSPEQFLGYPIGSHHTRWDKMVEYFKELDRLSDKVMVKKIGETWGHRDQIIVHISSVDNMKNLETIRQNHLQSIDLQNNNKTQDMGPIITWLGYNVHGNEPSGGEASMLSAYYLVASTSAETQQWLQKAVFLFEPVINPDGRDRHTHWANMHKGSPAVSDPLDREHNEVFPGGRTNHYWFDLNRDWFLAVHPESTNRLAFYHQWLPNVVTDFHEMGTNATHFFEPSKENAENPLVPKAVYKDLNIRFAKYFEAALNQIGSLYYTKDSFDNLYPGYGSSYPDLQGGLGLLFEQASSRGHAQDSQNGVVTFAFTIRNQLVNALATMQASVNEKDILQKHQKNFFADIVFTAKKELNKSIIVGNTTDMARNQAFWSLLLKHKIEAYHLTKNESIEGLNYEKGKAIIIPLDQAQNLLIKSIFDKPTTFADSLFYDASAWNLALSHHLNYGYAKTNIGQGNKLTIKDLEPSFAPFSQSSYAYLIDFQNYNVFKFLQELYSKDILVKSSTKPFKIEGKTYPRGTLLLPVKAQKMGVKELFELLTFQSKSLGVTVTAVNTGFSAEGVDLGSNSIISLKAPKAIMPIGAGVNSYEAGEIWHLLDNRVGLPVTKVDLSQLGRIDWSKYNTLILPGGNYQIDKPIQDKIKNWLALGNTLICQKEATEWAVRNVFLKEKLRDLKADSTKTALVNYEDVQAFYGAKRTGGAIFEARLDLTHPIAFGFGQNIIPVYRNNNTMMEPSSQAGRTVSKYTANALLAGYVHPETLKRINNSAAINIGYEGAGRIVAFTDNPNFRGIWYGTNRLFLNALYLGSIINNAQGGFGEE